MRSYLPSKSIVLLVVLDVGTQSYLPSKFIVLLVVLGVGTQSYLQSNPEIIRRCIRDIIGMPCTSWIINSVALEFCVLHVMNYYDGKLMCTLDNNTVDCCNYKEVD